MPVILHRSEINEGPGYDVVLIESGERLWLGLIGPRRDGVLRFWSTKYDELEHTPYEIIIDELEKRLALVHQWQDDLYNALMLWPAGWDYWGGGKPDPIGDYIDSGEFRGMFLRWGD